MKYILALILWITTYDNLFAHVAWAGVLTGTVVHAVKEDYWYILGDVGLIALLWIMTKDVE